MTLQATITTMAKAAREAANKLARVSSEQKNATLFAIADGLEEEADFIKAENQKDLSRAEEMGLSGAMIDRLTIKDETIHAMFNGLKEVAQLNDPVGTMGPTRIRPNGSPPRVARNCAAAPCRSVDAAGAVPQATARGGNP